MTGQVETWTWTVKTTDASNGGQVGIDAVTWDAVAFVNLNEKTAANRDMAPALAAFKADDELRLEQKTDSSRFGLYKLTGPGVDNGAWWQFPVVMETSGGSPPGGNADTLVTLIESKPMMGQCASCTYWSEYLPVDTGLCRRYAPRATPGIGLFAMWPVTKATDGCGDYVVDPSAPTLAYMMISPPKG